MGQQRPGGIVGVADDDQPGAVADLPAHVFEIVVSVGQDGRPAGLHLMARVAEFVADARDLAVGRMGFHDFAVFHQGLQGQDLGAVRSCPHPASGRGGRR